MDSAPAEGDELAAPPLLVVVNTDSEIADSSSISVTVNGQEATAGETELDANRLALRRSVSQDAPDGTYLVRYRVCQPDQSCDDGQFSFSVDRARLSGYQDLRGQTSVGVNLAGLHFVPDKIIVSPGTHIVWVNSEDAQHFVTTDPYLSKNYYPAQNSLAIRKGENYELTLNEAGEYLYHCSLHYPDGMLARIVVAE